MNPDISSFDQLFAGLSTNMQKVWLESGLDLNVLRTHDTSLEKDEWKALDTAIIQVARGRLNAVNDLRSRGLVRNLGTLGVLVDEWQTVSDMTEANIDMSGATGGEEDTVNYGITGVPIPIIHKDYRLDMRRLLSSRRMGTPIDTVQASTAARLVADQVERMLFYGSTVKADSRVVYGYTNFPYRTQVTIAGSWDITPANILPDVEKMLKASDLNKYFGPFVLYVGTKFWSALRKDYSVSGSSKQTYLERLRAYAEVDDVKPADTLAYNEVSLVQMTSDVIDLSVGADINNVQWATKGGLVSHYKVMTALAPRCKSDHNNKSGIVHGKTA